MAVGEKKLLLISSAHQSFCLRSCAEFKSYLANKSSEKPSTPLSTAVALRFLSTSTIPSKGSFELSFLFLPALTQPFPDGLRGCRDSQGYQGLWKGMEIPEWRGRSVSSWAFLGGGGLRGSLVLLVGSGQNHA